MRLEWIGIWFPKIRTKNLPCDNLKMVFYFFFLVFIVIQLNIILGVWIRENIQFYAYLENSINTCRIWIQYESSKWVEMWFNFWFVVYFVELIVFCSLLCFLFLFVDYWEYQQRLFSWQKCVFFVHPTQFVPCGLLISPAYAWLYLWFYLILLLWCHIGTMYSLSIVEN